MTTYRKPDRLIVQDKEKAVLNRRRTVTVYLAAAILTMFSAGTVALGMGKDPTPTTIALWVFIEGLMATGFGFLAGVRAKE